ncbi:hypothetical protein ACQJBY_004924 [Aegilops geniculata]
MAGATEAATWEEMLPPGTTIPEGAAGNLGYSIALEYDGPPVAYEVPRIAPVDMADVPTAEPVSASYGLLGNGGAAVPVFRPPASRARAEPPQARRGAGPVDSAPRDEAARARQEPPSPVQVRRSSEFAHSGPQNEGYSDSRRSVSRESAPSYRGQNDGGRHAMAAPEGRRSHVVTFGPADDSKYDQSSELDDTRSEQFVAVTRTEKRGKTCDRCGKSKWESKESSIVCDKRYCVWLLPAQGHGIDAGRPQVYHLHWPADL